MKKLITIVIAVLALSGCIKNDVPYPYIFGEIISLQIEGQNGNAIISQENQTVEIRVPFGMDRTQLKITDLVMTEEATIYPKIEELMDFSSPVTFTVSTYQDYDWTVTVIEDDFDIIMHEFEIEGQVSSEIDQSNRIIRVVISDTLDIENLNVVQFSYSPEQVPVLPYPFDVHDFSSEVTFLFDDIEWRVEVTYDDGEIENIGEQIMYSDFKTWYYGGRKANESNNSRKFNIPGEDFDGTPWRTGDVGAADLIIPTGVRTVYPSPSEEEYEYTTLKTTSALGVVAAGSLFVGDIQGSGLTNVQTDFGIPFTDQPKSFETTIQYIPELYDGSPDQCDVYVLLQVREGSGDNEKRYRLATAWYRSDETMMNFETINMPLLYGNHNDLAPFMMPSTANERMPEHGFAPTDSEPTHIIVVYSSSFDGANFKGGVGSELRVKGFELKY
ncbi:PCMD domain-containing protein [Flammeovirga yaeyamensis]|uniref:PCMD domain-containing protein n=1 Tax=Flammeovirga yaeyamensis TaxID=367791 RepID=A0AAX1NDI6_9BACT|nr:PCMD domain-containing protein [Flammeovirga yaeyamensis]MBB3699523.1 hypothetical protein [Flammeovirga yaeyamensis]NMF35221.1 hypothetical protein [Flammeovirga yaeyamensis]QWG04083.1 PCMD domain-containing protein [Flammeovirga yaeyamensis]